LSREKIESTIQAPVNAGEKQRSRTESLGALPRGTSLGRYLVLDPLGQGGMGVVYAAFDPELDRRVAIKLLRSDLGSAERRTISHQRMVREAQAMARLSHPNVIPVYDVGTAGERLFVAMELVDGGTLTEWLRGQTRSWRDVLEVYIQAGRGLAAAHAAGLVHRDFKPDNVLIGRDGRPRVTDFGLARAIDSAEAPAPASGDRHVDASSSSSLHQPLTRQDTMMGTPGYMSPEQVFAEAIDARTDQFSFCASLYEGLYRERPFDGVDLEKMVEAVERGEVRPAPADSPVPAWLRKALVRGLAFDPAQRWPSMDALLHALQRDPRVRRRRFAIALSGVALLAVAVGVARPLWHREELVCRGAERKLVGVWDGSRRQGIEEAFRATERPYAAHAWQEVSRALDAYAAAWTGMHTEACESTRVRGEQAESTLALRMTCLDRRKKELKALTDLFLAADGETVERAVQATGELSPVAMCADVDQLTAAVPPPADPKKREQVDAIRTDLTKARASLQAGKYQAGLDIVKPLLARAHQVGYRPVEAEGLELEGRLAHRASDYKAAGEAFQAAVYAAEEGRVDDVKIAAATHLATVSVDLHGFDVAHDWLRFADAALKRIGSPSELYVDLLVASAAVNFRHSRYAESEQAARQAVALAEKTFGPSHLNTAAAWSALGDSLKYLGRHADALAALERGRAIEEQLLGGDHPEVALVLRKEADAYAMMHDGARELELSRRALAIFERVLPADHLWIAQTHTNASEALVLLGHHGEAIAEERRALPIYEKIFGPASENVGVSLTNIGAAEARLGRGEQARRDLTRAAAIYEQTLGPENPDLAEPLLRLGQLALAEKRPQAAQAPLERALRLRAHDGDPCEMLAEIELALARALDGTGGDRARARTLAAQAEGQLRNGGKSVEAAEASSFLARLK
jgi:tetratricopeptide (TPR) repeat protein/tRNA A-37 threonylcarbamoyl transferase component Bud32